MFLWFFLLSFLFQKFDNFSIGILQLFRKFFIFLFKLPNLLFRFARFLEIISIFLIGRNILMSSSGFVHHF